MTGQIHLRLFVLGLLAFAGCDDLPTAKLDRGGKTFDLRAISDARYPMRETGDAVRRVERCGTNQPAQQVALSLDWKGFHRGDTHGIAFRYRYRQSHVGREPRVRLIVRGVGPERKTLTQKDWKTKIRETGDRWAIYRLEDTGIVSKTTYAQFVIDFADNLGVLEIKDVQGIPNRPLPTDRDPAKHQVETRILGVDVIGGDYHLAHGCVQGIEFDWRLVGKSVTRKGPWTWVFAVPKGVDIVSTCGAKPGTVERTTDADGRVTVRHGIAGEWLPADRGWKGWKHPAVYVKSCLPPGTDPGEGTYTVLCDGRPVSEPLAFPIRIVEPFAADAVPKRYLNGVIFTGPDTELDDPSGREGYAQTLVDAGVRFMRGVRAPLAEAVEKRTKVVLAASPLAWMELSDVSEKSLTNIAALVKVWKREREKWHGGVIHPVGGRPDGDSWTGFVSECADGIGYALVFREYNGKADYTLDLEPIFGTTGLEDVRVLSGRGSVAAAKGTSLTFSIPRRLDFLWVKFRRGGVSSGYDVRRFG